MRALALPIIIAGVLTLAPAAAWAGQADQIDWQSELNKLKDTVQAQAERIAELESQLQNNSIDARRAEEIKQLIKEVLADTEVRSQLLGSALTAGYDKGFYIKTEDEAWLLKVNSLLQFRYVGIVRANNDEATEYPPVKRDRSDFELERARIILSGHIPSGLSDEPIKYFIQFDADTDGELRYQWYAPQEMGNLEQGGQVKLLDWYATYKVCDELQLKAGQYKLPFGRQELTNPAALMLVDRSMANEFFNVGRGISIGAFGDINIEGLPTMGYEVALSNGFQSDNRSEVNALGSFGLRGVDCNGAVVLRLVWDVKGDRSLFDEESALGWETGKYDDWALSAGFSFAYQDNNSELLPIYFMGNNSPGSNGGIGVISGIGTEVTKFAWDAAFKWKQLAASAEWFVQIIDFDTGSVYGNPVADVDGSRHTEHQQGMYLQGGYFFTEKLEGVVRFGAVWDNDGDDVWEYAAGANYYIRGNDVKLSLDITRIPEVPVISPDANLSLNQDITMFRAQLQIAF